MSAKNILITGRPGIGKTTLILKLVEDLMDFGAQGFYTREIRIAGTRQGFELVDLKGERFTLAHIDFGGRHRVGKYAVDIQSFDNYLRARDLAGGPGRLIIIDEIGKMECLSAIFEQAVTDILASDKTLIATIAVSGGGIIHSIKNRRDVHLVEIDVSNRGSMVAQIAQMISGNRTGL